MSNDKRAILNRQRSRGFIESLAFGPRQPSKEELRAMTAQAFRNTAVLPVAPAPAPIYPHGKTRSEHGGGSA